MIIRESPCAALSRFLLLVFALALLAVTGCRKIENPNPDLYQREHNWLFFNYVIDKPPGDPGAETGMRTVGKMVEGDQRFAGLSLHVLAPPDYLPAAVLRNFTEEFGAEVEVDSVESNVDLYGRVSGGEHCDLMIVSDYMIQRLVEEQRLSPLDSASIPNVALIEREFRESDYDPGSRHSVPYLWTTMGIAFNVEHLDDLPRTWDDLFNPKAPIASAVEGKRSLLAAARSSVAAALMALDYSPDTENREEVQAALDYLEARMKSFRFLSNQNLVQAFSKREVLIGQATSAEVVRMGNSEVHFTVPEEGTWISIDAFAIPKQISPLQKDLAEAFINYMLQPAIAAAVVNRTFHATTVGEATPFVNSGIRQGASYMRPADPKRTFILSSTATNEAFQEDIWKKMRDSARRKVRKSTDASTRESPADSQSD